MTDWPPDGMMNRPSGPSWERRSWIVDLDAGEIPGATIATVDGMARFVFGLSPDARPISPDMPVQISHLPTGMVIAECPHGAAAMEAVDELILYHGGMFADWPLVGEKVVAAIPSITAKLEAAGCRLLIIDD